MKRNQLIIVAIFILISALIYIRIISNKKVDSKNTKEAAKEMFVPIRTVENKIRRMEIISYGQVTPVSEIDVATEVQGKLLEGSITMKPGVKFSKGQVLYRVDNAEALYTLNARKTQLANLLIQAMPDIELDYPSQVNKWIDFLNGVQPDKSLPELPSFNSGKERMFMTARNIISEYYNIKSLENRLAKYTYVAPFSGTVISIVSEPGSIVNPGTRIARIAKTGDYEVKVPISMEQMELYKQKGVAEFTDAKGNVIGNGKIIRVSDVINQRTQSADVYYSITANKEAMVYNGMFLNARINQQAEIESMAIPRLAVFEGKVNLLKNNAMVAVPVIIESTKPDTVFVSGLKDGDKVVLEQIQVGKGIETFKGIER